MADQQQQQQPAAGAKRPAPPAAGGEHEVTRSKKGKKGKRGSAAAESVEAGAGDFVRVFPLGKHAGEEPGSTVRLSAKDKAPGLSLSEDRLSVTGAKGFRSVRATHGAHVGTFYCEASLTRLGATGHARVGWATKKAELNAPVGYDGHGFAYRDLEGSKVSRGLREPYGEPLSEGDVVGLFLHLPPGGRRLEARPDADLVRHKGSLYMRAPEDEAVPAPLPGAVVAFTRNGVLQGVAFADVPEGTYYPAASLFTLPSQAAGATVAFNFGPDFKHAPPDVPGCPPAEPLSVLPAKLAAAADAEAAAEQQAAAAAAEQQAAAAAAAAAEQQGAAAAAAGSCDAQQPQQGAPAAPAAAAVGDAAAGDAAAATAEAGAAAEQAAAAAAAPAAPS